MKRIFLILCLITICNISYADIASVGYVDSVVATKQDTISDIATIRSGAGLGATAVQPSSLSTVATSGSYNDLSNKPTIPNIPTGPNDGNKYTLVWDGKTGRFIFEEMSTNLQCDTSQGMYDIGFDQCVDLSVEGNYYGYWNFGGDTDNPSVFDLTEAGQWGVEFSYGIVKGIASCNSTSGTFGVATNEEFSQSVSGQYCWCKMTYPVVSSWVFAIDRDSSSTCSSDCASGCGMGVHEISAFRRGVFAAVGD